MNQTDLFTQLDTGDSHLFIRTTCNGREKELFATRNPELIGKNNRNLRNSQTRKLLHHIGDYNNDIVFGVYDVLRDEVSLLLYGNTTYGDPVNFEYRVENDIEHSVIGVRYQEQGFEKIIYVTRNPQLIEVILGESSSGYEKFLSNEKTSCFEIHKKSLIKMPENIITCRYLTGTKSKVRQIPKPLVSSVLDSGDINFNYSEDKFEEIMEGI